MAKYKLKNEISNENNQNVFKIIKLAIEQIGEFFNQTYRKKKIEDIYVINDTPSLINFTLQTTFYLPSVILKLRKINEIKSKRFWYLNRNKEAIEGIIYSSDTKNPLPLIAFDSGYKRDLFNFSMVGKIIACLGYRVFSVRSRNELKSTEAEDYMDAFDFLKTKYQEKELLENKSAIIGLSGGNIIVYKACSSQEFVERHNIKCGISISPFDDLAEQFNYMKNKLKERDIPENTRRVLSDYNKYVESLGITDTSDSYLFTNGSPITYCKDLKVPLLIEHGIMDDIVPVTGSLKIYKTLKQENKKVELVLIPGKGIHGDLKKWKENIIETIGLISSIIYAYKFLRKHMSC
ncbi:MAG: prolyl oligopeptidase family serine peptidase [Candidatus Micrarchaeia archaeon]